MLRKDIRVIVFVSCIVLLFILVYQYDLKQTSVNLGVDIPSIASHDQQKILLSLSHDRANQNVVQDDHDEQEEAVPEDHEDYGSLPDYVIRGVNRFLLFIGYVQSGHSIVASMLDAHPHVVIAHDYSLFSKWQDNPYAHADKHWLFNTLYINSKNITSERYQANKKEYSLFIPGSWQGQYDSSISVIGDKSGWITAEIYRRNKEVFIELYGRLKKTVQVPIDVIHVIRNPYDNIAAMLLHKRNATEMYELMQAKIVSYFEQVQNVNDMINALHLSVTEVHNSDMIAKPKAIMRTLCDRLRISCSEQFLQMCAHKTLSSESKSRHQLKWTRHQIDLVAQNIKKYDHLKRYSFTS